MSYMLDRKEWLNDGIVHMWEFWAAITKSNFQGLFNDTGNVLTIMLSNETKTLVEPHDGTTSMEGNLAATP